MYLFQTKSKVMLPLKIHLDISFTNFISYFIPLANIYKEYLQPVSIYVMKTALKRMNEVKYSIGRYSAGKEDERGRKGTLFPDTSS